MLVLSRSDVEAVLDVDALLDAIARAMVDVSAGRASMPARIAAHVADRGGLLAAMPAFLPSAGALTTKLVSLFPRNRDRPTHQAVICCFDPDTGTPTALLDGTAITTARTAAGSALATRLLARRDARRVAVVGTGEQARSHGVALGRLDGISHVVVAGRDPAKAAGVAAELVELGLPAAAAPSIEGAVRSADIVCAVTHADAPVVRRAWLRPGTHVNSVGYNTEGDGEVDLETVRDALVVVESRAAALAPPPAGALELLRARDAGILDTERVRELGELVAGSAEGRVDDAQITLYKSVGVAAQDAAAAALVLEAAHTRGIGTRVDL